MFLKTPPLAGWFINETLVLEVEDEPKPGSRINTESEALRDFKVNTPMLRIGNMLKILLIPR